ncbi:PASTA domain-containing protein [Ornithinimicrobium sp. W1679]|uniref:PASTA domain-containing protein n=1 Tax=Ornithinimicrobium sp. W1679 TaxID=3418770 RepID=UPI003CF11511
MRTAWGVLAATALILPLAACSEDEPITMPDVVGKSLDVANSDVERAGFGDEVEVLGGGLFGIVDESNWTVCSQEPGGGSEITSAPRLTVDRTCGENEPSAAAEPSDDPLPGEEAAHVTAGETTAAKTEATKTEDAVPAESATDTPGADPRACETKPGGDPCTFGQTAIYRDTVRSGRVVLEITVKTPVEFEPSDDASVAYDLPLHPVNIYFPVTVTNKSDSGVDDTMLLTQATNAEQGAYDGILEVSDAEINSSLSLPAPGDTLTVNHGWSMTTLDGVEYALSVDGQAGYTVKFTE